MKPRTAAGREVANRMFYDWMSEYDIGRPDERAKMRAECDELVAAVEIEAVELSRVTDEGDYGNTLAVAPV